jgi:hypothetical protein
MKMKVLKKLFGITLMSVYVSLITPTQTNAQGYSRMSCYDLWYERNAIFARKGFCFSTRRAIRTFGRRCYPPYGRLSLLEEDIVDEIKYWERRKGCRY